MHNSSSNMINEKYLNITKFTQQNYETTMHVIHYIFYIPVEAFKWEKSIMRGNDVFPRTVNNKFKVRTLSEGITGIESTHAQQ